MTIFLSLFDSLDVGAYDLCISIQRENQCHVYANARCNYFSNSWKTLSGSWNLDEQVFPVDFFPEEFRLSDGALGVVSE